MRPCFFYALVFAVAFVSDFLVELYYYSLLQKWTTLTLALATTLPWVHCLAAIILIDAKTWRQRLLITGIYSVALLASTAAVLWLVRG